MDKREITALLGTNEPGVRDRLFSVVYEELRGIAHRHLLRERNHHTLGTTALVHECFLSLVDQTRSDWKDRAHFFAIASRAMRHILIDYARRRNAKKRGGKQQPLSFEADMGSVAPQAVELISLDAALTDLARKHRRMAEVVECRYFGGMTVDETATALGVSVTTVERDWRRAKAYLYEALA